MGGTADFIFVSEDFSRDHPNEAHWKQFQLGSLEYPRDVYVNGFHIPEKYVVTAKVDCPTPRQFLAEQKLEASDIDIFMTYVFGADIGIVSAFMDAAESFKPILINFDSKGKSWAEKKGLSLGALMSRLERSGYVAWNVGDNTTAMRSGDSRTGSLDNLCDQPSFSNPGFNPTCRPCLVVKS